MTQFLVEARLGYGALLLLANDDLLAKLAHAPVDGPMRLFARVLGVRELLQAELMRRHPTQGARSAGAGVDAIHAASMLALSRVDPLRRGPARRNAATAAAWSMAGLIGAYRTG